MVFARGEKVYKVAVNAKGCWTLYELERWSWHLIASGEDASVQLAATINADSDKDMGFSAKVSVPWPLIGGAPRKGETLRAHLCRMYKNASSEKPAAIFEELEGENGDYPCDWLRVILK